jgi:hypothetical protein
LDNSGQQWILARQGLSANDPKRTLDVGRIFGLHGRESYLELRLEPLYFPIV